MLYAILRSVPADAPNICDCTDSNIPGKRQHHAAGRSPRCEFHREQRARWVDLTGKARSRGSQSVHMAWEEYATPRPTLERGLAISDEQATTIIEATAFLSTARAPLDSQVRQGAHRILFETTLNLLNALDEPSQALRPIIRRQER